MFDDLIRLTQPQGPGPAFPTWSWAGLEFNLLLGSRAPLPGAACPPRVRPSGLFMASDLVYLTASELFCRRRAQLPAVCSAAAAVSWARMDGRAEPIALAEELVAFLGVIYVMWRGRACTRPSPPRAFPAQGSGMDGATQVSPAGGS